MYSLTQNSQKVLKAVTYSLKTMSTVSSQFESRETGSAFVDLIECHLRYGLEPEISRSDGGQGTAELK